MIDRERILTASFALVLIGSGIVGSSIALYMDVSRIAAVHLYEIIVTLGGLPPESYVAVGLVLVVVGVEMNEFAKGVDDDD